MTDMPVLPEDFLSAARDGFGDKSVIVTGATGFIGRRLVAALLELGAEVTVILRSGHGASGFKRRGASVEIGQLSNGEFLANALKQKGILFHLAYDVRASGRENLDVFSTLCSAAQASELQRIVHMSSMVVYDHWPAGKIDQTAAVTRTGLEDYRDAKIAMEEALMAGAKPAALLQPGIVHGPGSAMWTDGPRAALKQGPVILPDPVGLCPAIHVDDVVQAALRAGLVPELGHERFILNGPETLDWSAFYKAHIDAIGQGSVELLPMQELEDRLPAPGPETAVTSAPSAAARLSRALRQVLGRERFEAMVRMASAMIGKSGPTYPNRSTLRLLGARAEISDEYARTRLGYSPIRGLDS